MNEYATKARDQMKIASETSEAFKQGRQLPIAQLAVRCTYAVVHALLAIAQEIKHHD